MAPDAGICDSETTSGRPPRPAAAEMPVPEIMAALSTINYILPEAALYAAEARREEITPLLLSELQRYASGNGDSSATGDAFAFFGLYLLASFRDGRALAHLREFLDRHPKDEDALEAIGFFEGSDARLFASLAFASPGALHHFVENRTYPETIRGNALEAYLCLWFNHAIQTEEARAYLKHVGNTVLRREPEGPDNWLWYAWARCCIVLGLEEWYPLIKTAFEEKWIDPMISTWEHEEQEIAKGRDYILEDAKETYGSLMGHAADELRDWYCFSEQARKDDERRKAAREKERENREHQHRKERQTRERGDFIPAGTIVNAKPKIKPNQPCPCKSGKKYKKCCGR
jgi:uncharacterized protein YchJ